MSTHEIQHSEIGWFGKNHIIASEKVPAECLRFYGQCDQGKDVKFKKEDHLSILSSHGLL